MTINEIENRLKELKERRKQLDDEIASLEKEIKQKKRNIVSSSLDKNNKTLFKYYIVEVKKLKVATFSDYCSALKDMQEMLCNIYDYVFDFSFIVVDDPIFFNKMVAKFEDSAELVAENRRRHYDISAAYNNFYAFLLSKRG